MDVIAHLQAPVRGGAGAVCRGAGAGRATARPRCQRTCLCRRYRVDGPHPADHHNHRFRQPAGRQHLYCLEALDAGGAVLASQCFDLSFADYETGEASGVEGFNIALPYAPGVARVILRKDAQELAARAVSAHAPEVAITYPNGGQGWGASGTYTVTWAACDGDGDPLTYYVLYSPNGADWLPVNMAIAEMHLAVDAAELPGGSGARVRVLATDGFGTTVAESAAALTVGRKPPEVYILAPEGDVAIAAGTPLWLRGHAYDLEDGLLDGAALQWSSRVQGALGTGSQVLVALAPHTHIVTLRATDSDGNVSTASVIITVVSPVSLPLVLRG